MAVIHEEFKTQVAAQNELAERVQTERKVLLNKVRQEGFELGVRSSSKFSYKDFSHFDRVSSLAACLDEDALDYLWAYLDGKEYPEQARMHDADFAHLLEVDPQSRIVFVQGWIEGVLSVWQEIKAQVEGDRPEPQIINA